MKKEATIRTQKPLALQIFQFCKFLNRISKNVMCSNDVYCELKKLKLFSQNLLRINTLRTNGSKAQVFSLVFVQISNQNLESTVWKHVCDFLLSKNLYTFAAFALVYGPKFNYFPSLNLECNGRLFWKLGWKLASIMASKCINFGNCHDNNSKQKAETDFEIFLLSLLCIIKFCTALKFKLLH